MIMIVLNIIFYLLLFIQLIVLAICIYNLFTAPGLRINKHIGEEKKISVLIPARNEESNIDECLDSIFKSDYQNFEVLLVL